ncbi:hypothetical protein CDAR_111821 [Caerostris darwini]|uniref:Uncharacterized protein n=1 Tax=Caerostris darwini TaxID=1538125 RepID=A0AAV4PZQ1_9ARAC|nr:hypothetical protein CDAR_111821 [Caerostris darwini]
MHNIWVRYFRRPQIKVDPALHTRSPGRQRQRPLIFDEGSADSLLNLSLRSIAPREHRDPGKKTETQVGTAIPVHGRRWSMHRDLDSFRSGVPPVYP